MLDIFYKNNDLIKLKNKILEVLTLLGIITFISVALVAYINGSSKLVIVSSILSSFFIAIVYFFLRNKKSIPLIRNILILFLMLYFPYAWLINYGSTNAMMFYAVLIFFIIS